MVRKPTGAERYLDEQKRDPEFLAAYEAARWEIEAARAAESKGQSPSDD